MKAGVRWSSLITGTGRPSRPARNVIVDAEIAQLDAAGVEVVPFLRSSDEIGALPTAGQGAAAALADLRPTGPARAAPSCSASTARTCCTCTTRTR